MATFKLTDGISVNATITPGSSSALSKYFQNLPDFKVSNIDLSQPPVTSVDAGLSFSQPIDIGTSGVELKVGASASATLSIFVPSTDGAPLFKEDPFGDVIKVGKDQRYVGMALKADLNGSASASPGDLKFGFDGKAQVNLAYYEQFDSTATLLNAVEDTIAKFSIPGDLDDIDAMPVNSIATVDSSGDLKFSGSVNLLSFANPLATATLPAGLGSIGVKAGASIDVGATYTFSGDYQLRVQKVAQDVCRIGFYRERNSAFSFTVDANASLAAKLGDNDLIVKLMTAISSDAKADLDQLKAAGLSEDQAKAIQTAVKSAINRTLEIGASLELSRTDESKAMFLYEVDLTKLKDDGRAMLHSALDGDLRVLVAGDLTPADGITVLKTLISKTKTFQHTFKLNLLGIYNVLQISKLVIEGKTAWDADTGQMVLTDSATADKIKVIASNLQAKDSAKLRQVLAEHFLITAAYHAVKSIVGPPTLTALQTFFELQSNPSKVRMRDYLLVSATLGLQSAPVAQSQLPNKVDDFGGTTIYAEAGYDDKAFRSLFFDNNGGLFAPQTYSDAGRLAIQSLVEKGDDDDFRLAMATDRNLFNTLAANGNPQSSEFRAACRAAGVPGDFVPVVGTDFIDVVWFTEAMVTAGQKLQAIDTFLQNNPNVDPENNNFKKLKQQLADSLGKVADRATVDFGGPWGFETMALLGKASSKKWILVNRFITSTLPRA